jgi:hypothetical protein
MAPTANKTKRSDDDENCDFKRRKGLDGRRVNDRPVDKEVPSTSKGITKKCDGVETLIFEKQPSSDNMNTQESLIKFEIKAFQDQKIKRKKNARHSELH